MADFIELKPIEEWKGSYDQVEERLRMFFRKMIYIPLLKKLSLPRKIISNAINRDPLLDALFSKKITYYGGRFSGEFNAATTKTLKKLGAKWDRKTQSFLLEESSLPTEVKAVIASSQVHFVEQMKKIDDHLSKIVPEELATEFKCADIFDKTLFRADRDFRQNVKNITVTPKLTEYQRKRIADEWQNNMQLYIKDWTEEQIKSLRAKLFDDVMSGQRRESQISPILKITKTIQESHEEALNKAKFLAHQETRLMISKFKEVRYQDAGIKEYIWRNVHRPKDTSPNAHIPGNVRYSHALLDGKIFRFDDPPITTNPGETVRKNNPGCDFRCRCFARPLLRKQKAAKNT